MDLKSSTHSSAREITIPVITISAEEQTRRVEAAIAKRAYQIFEKRGGMAWHELEDWRQAERELHGSICCSRTTENHTIIIGTDPGGFAPGSLEIWVAPTRVTLSGDWHPRHPHHVAAGVHPPLQHIFRSIELPCPVDPAGAQAYVRNQFLEIKLPQTVTVPQTTHGGAA
jgi:HSP20 family molecular chaperone IbpA